MAAQFQTVKKGLTLIHSWNGYQFRVCFHQHLSEEVRGIINLMVQLACKRKVYSIIKMDLKNIKQTNFHLIKLRKNYCLEWLCATNPNRKEIETTKMLECIIFILMRIRRRYWNSQKTNKLSLSSPARFKINSSMWFPTQKGGKRSRYSIDLHLARVLRLLWLHRRRKQSIWSLEKLLQIYLNTFQILFQVTVGPRLKQSWVESDSMVKGLYFIPKE